MENFGYFCFVLFISFVITSLPFIVYKIVCYFVYRHEKKQEEYSEFLSIKKRFDDFRSELIVIRKSIKLSDTRFHNLMESFDFLQSQINYSYDNLQSQIDNLKKIVSKLNKK